MYIHLFRLSVAKLKMGYCWTALKEMPITLNSDHEPQSDAYELPTSFFKMVLGKYLKFRYVILLYMHMNYQYKRKNKKNKKGMQTTSQLLLI